MFFKRSAKRQEKKRKKEELKKAKYAEKKKLREGKSEVNQGLVYMYAIIGIQILLVFGLVMVFMVVGKVITTPWWALLLIVAAVLGGCGFIYYRIKRSFRRLKETVRDMNVADRNYEISIMGGAVTMRVEKNPNRLLEAPPDRKVIDAVGIETEKVTSKQNPEKKRNQEEVIFQ